jgi:hypothetical protein
LFHNVNNGIFNISVNYNTVHKSKKKKHSGCA